MTERNIKEVMEKNNYSMSHNYKALFEAIEDIYKEINELQKEIAEIKINE
jgi:hypothetical protein